MDRRRMHLEGKHPHNPDDARGERQGLVQGSPLLLLHELQPVLGGHRGRLLQLLGEGIGPGHGTSGGARGQDQEATLRLPDNSPPTVVNQP
ncbi:MAG: hypothetical protein ACKOOC_09890 [Cyanobium sp.]